MPTKKTTETTSAKETLNEKAEKKPYSVIINDVDQTIYATDDEDLQKKIEHRKRTMKTAPIETIVVPASAESTTSVLPQ